MVAGFAWLLVFQLAGEVLVRSLQLPVPGPVVGMLLLLLVLIWRGEPGENLRSAGQGLLANLSLLFVPAGVGIMVHGLAVTALVMRACHQPGAPASTEPPQEQP